LSTFAGFRIPLRNGPFHPFLADKAGAIFTVKSFTQNGDIVLDNGWVVGKDFGHIAHGYVVTSQASQGRTVDEVLIGQSEQSLPASNLQQLYVSVSCGHSPLRRSFMEPGEPCIAHIARLK
jgi:hypothetical protein